MKKRLSLALSLLLLVTTILGVFPAYAEDTPATTVDPADAAAVEEGKAFKVGDKYFEHLSDAFKAVEDYGTIYQIADYEVNTTVDYYVGTGKNFTLDGQITNKNEQYTLKINAGNTYPLSITRNVTIKNLNLASSKQILAFTPQEEGDCFTLENVKADETPNNAAFLLAGANGGPGAKTVLGKFVIKDCEIIADAAPFFVGNNATASWDVDIINSTLVNTNATSSYPYAVLLYKSPSIDLTVDGTSKLLNTSTTSTAPNAIKVSTSTANDPKACVITLEEGATLGLKSESGAPAGSFIAKGSDTATYVLNDKGANYVASAYMQKKGVTLPTVTALDSAKLDEKGSFTAGSVTVADAGTYTNASATAEITLAYTGGTIDTPEADDVIVTSDFNYYTNMKAAADKLYEYGTVYVLKNFTDATQAKFTKAVTIDGGGHEVTLTNGGYAWFFRNSAVLKNITITDTAYSAINFAPLSDEPLYVMDNVQGTTTNESRPFLGIGVSSSPASIDTVADVIIKDSNLSGYAPVFVGNDGISSFNIDIINSTLTNPKASSSYPYVILLYKSPMINLTVDGTSKLVNSSTNATYAPDVIQVGSNTTNAPAKCNITLEKGAELSLNSASGAPAGDFIRVNDATKNLKIGDQGAKYTASAYMQGKGVTLPNNTAENFVGYGVNDKLYKGNIGEYTDTNASEAITFETVTFDANDFANKAGASIRTANDAYAPAIRFTANVEKTFYDKLYAYDNNVKFGTLVALNDSIAEGDIVNAASKYANEISVWAVNGENDAVWAYNTAVFNIDAGNYETDLAATAYFTVAYEDGTTATFYAAFNETKNVRSLYDVAQAAYEAGTTDNAQINTIIGAVNGAVDPVAAELAATVLNSPAKTVNTGNGCVESVWTDDKVVTDTNYTALCNSLESNDYSLYAEKVLNNQPKKEGIFGIGAQKKKDNYYRTYINGEYILNVMFIEDNDTDDALNTKKICMTYEPKSRTPLQGTAAENVYTDLGVESLLTNVGLYYDASVDENGYALTGVNGMSFVYRLCDGSFIIIDGGFSSTGNADRLYNILKKQANNGDIVIAAWIFSHDHDDHVGLFKSFSTKYYNQVTVEKFIYNFPSANQDVTGEGLGDTWVTPTISQYYPNAVVHKAHTGHVYYIRNATVNILFAMDAYEPLPLSGTVANGDHECNYNCSSMIMQIEVEDVTTTFLGDCQNVETAILKDMYDESVFKSDIVQAAHHGIWGCDADFYEDYTKATYTVIPLGADKAKVNSVYWDSILYFKSSSHDLSEYENPNGYFVQNGSLKSKVYVSEDNVVVFALNGGNVTATQHNSVEAYLAS